MEGIFWVIRNDEQQQKAADLVRKHERGDQAWSMKWQLYKAPKTLKQLKYIHSLINAIAIHASSGTETVKTDVKREFGIIEVSTSTITGARTARLKSFAEYSKEELEAVIAQTQVHCDENGIPYTPSED